MELYGSPASTFVMKTVIALYEKNVDFKLISINLSNPEERAKYEEIYPFSKVPYLKVNDDHNIPQSSIIVEYVDQKFQPKNTLLPVGDEDFNRQIRFLDRMADDFLNSQAFPLVIMDKESDAHKKAKNTVEKFITKLDQKLEGKKYIMGDDFTLADCSLIPTLLYCKQLNMLDELKHISSYLERALERPSVARAQKEKEAFFAQMNKDKS